MYRLLQLTMLFLLSSSVAAYELNGSLFNYNEGDGTLIVTVKDDKGDTYSGNATETDNGYYQLNLKNKSTGNVADGELEAE